MDEARDTQSQFASPSYNAAQAHQHQNSVLNNFDFNEIDQHDPSLRKFSLSFYGTLTSHSLRVDGGTREVLYDREAPLEL